MNAKMNLNDVVMSLRSAVLEYFAGERQEMLLILSGSLLVTVMVLGVTAPKAEKHTVDGLIFSRAYARRFR